MIKGCDLSAVQGVLPDGVWRQMADQGLRFAFLRAVVGNETWVDGSAAENARRARAFGLLVAPYVFLYPLPHLDAREQAEYFVRRLEGMGMRYDELPPMLDAEWPPREERRADRSLTYPWRRWGCSAEQIREHLLECIERCEELTGLVWPLYTYRYWLACIEAEKAPELARRPLVLADYKYSGRWPTDDELAGLKPPPPWTQIAFVQHDGNGGMKLPSGADADFDCFLGTDDELRALARPRGSLLEVLPAAVIDVELARQQMRGAIVDDAIAAYRRTRIDEQLADA
jgi:GH25 family lysozyme M1 (1,4-beta-N-acetylmuramidase)